MNTVSLLIGKFPIYWGYVILSSLLTCAGNLCLKQARVQDEGIISPFFITGLFFFSINFIIFSRAIEQIPISLAYPVFAGLGFILIAVFSNFLFQENLSAQQWIGMLIVLIGLACMTN